MHPLGQVLVYWNFHGLFLFQRVGTSKVIGESPSVMLKDAKFCIFDKAKRDLSRRTGSRTFHAGVEGEVTEVEDLDDFVEVMYDFKRFDFFVTFDEKKPVSAAEFVRFDVLKQKPRMLARGLVYVEE